MGTSYRPYNPDQVLLMPPSLSEWLREDHLAHFIKETVEELNLGDFYERYEGDGRRSQPYEPRMMLQVLLYGYCTGTFSSRKIAKKMEEDVAYRYLGANNFPSHRTICGFRKDHLELFEGLFVQLVQIAQEAGLVKLGVVAIDGTKIKANASKHKAMSYKRMKGEQEKLQAEVREIELRVSGPTRKADEIDQEEDRLFGEDFRGDELPNELKRREDRLKKIREAKKKLEQRHKDEHDGAPTDKSQINFPLCQHA